MQLSKITTYSGRMLNKQEETIRVIRKESEKTTTELGAKIDSAKNDIAGEK